MEKGNIVLSLWRAVPARWLAAPLILIIVVACSTKHNTWLSRGYQRMSSHYNVYFNGRTAFDDGIDKIRDSYQNDYSRVLPIYEFSDPQAAKSGQADMETALKKAHKLVQLHSITVKPARRDGPQTDDEKRFRAKEEFNPYVPMGYLLMGMANVVIHEEREAIETFDYLSRKHEGEAPTYEAKIWTSIAYVQLGQYNSALAALRGYDMDGVAPAALYPEYQAARANIHIAQGQYAEAIPYMERAAAETKNRHCRDRYAYILAQLYREVGDKAKAAPIFLSLSRSMGNYDMAFAAKLDLATVASSAGELQKAEKALRKMAKDPKNIEQLDQVYYAIGHLELNKGNRQEAKAALVKSVKASVTNDNQKGLSYLSLADIYQAEPEYIEASESLDSAAAFLSTSNARKDEAIRRSERLAPLAKELRTIRDNDSTLALARMDAKSRNAILERMAKEHNDRLDAEQEAREAEEANAMSQSDYYQVTQNMRTSGQQASWYFYNNQLVTAGKSTFRSRWGNRKNEDNWRRADKTSNAFDAADENPDAEATAEVKEAIATAADPAKQRWTKESLEQGLPLTAEAQAENERQTAQALVRSASILYDDLADYDRCVEQLEEYLRRFGGGDREYDALALLHFAQGRQGDAAGQRNTDKTIAQKYPESMLARSLADPSYMGSLAAAHDESEARYRETYAAYLASDFARAQHMATQALATVGGNGLRPQYLLVRAMAEAKQGDAEAMRADLSEIVSSHPATPQDTLAESLLALLDKGMEPVRHTAYDSPLSRQWQAEAEAPMPEKVAYAYEPDSAHVVLCVIDPGKQKDALFAIADYNFTNYILTDYDIAMLHLPNGCDAVILSPFKDRKEAEVYLYALREQPFWKKLTEAAIPQIFMMSKNNLRLCALSGIDEAFLQFMGQNYGLGPKRE